MNSNRTHWHSILIALPVCAFLIPGCSSMSRQQDPMEWAAAYPSVTPPPVVANGSIYQPGRDASLFSNATARNVGDLLTVRLEEATRASKSAKTSTSKSQNVSIPGPTIGGRPVTVNGVPILETEIDADRSFDGEGDSAQSNQLSGSLTVTVVGRAGNGNLLVRGQKWILINQGREFVRVEGIVRPIDVEPDNSVPSWKVADARISYGGKGAVADANAMGWVARFFNSPAMPF